MQSTYVILSELIKLAHSIYKLIPQAMHRQNILWLVRIGFEFLSKIENVAVDCTGVGIRFVAPNFVQDLLTCDDFVSPLDEKLEERELCGGEIDWLSFSKDLELCEIYFDVPELVGGQL